MNKKVILLIFLITSCFGEAIIAKYLGIDSLQRISQPLKYPLARYLDSLNSLYFYDLKIFPAGNTGSVIELPTEQEFIKQMQSLNSPVGSYCDSIVIKYLQLYFNNEHKSRYLLSLSEKYLSEVEAQLQAELLPKELKALPLALSGLYYNAVSAQGYAGPWQLSYPTARLYGLRIDSYIDERRSWKSSTPVAIKILKELYSIYNDWPLTIAAFSSGPTNVNKAIRRAKRSDFSSIYPFLPEETRDAVPAFYASIYFLNFYAKHNLNPLSIAEMPVADTVQIRKKLHLQQVAEIMNIDSKLLREMNAIYRQQIIPALNPPVCLYLPQDKKTLFLALKDSVYNYKASVLFNVYNPSDVAFSTVNGSLPKQGEIWHTVKKGESLSSISRKYGVNISHIQKLNRLKTTTIHPGQRLLIKQESHTVKTDLKTESTKTASTPVIPVRKPVTTTKTPIQEKIHIVASGENLWVIAKKYGVTVQQIKTANNMNSDMIRVGQKLKIPVR